MDYPKLFSFKYHFHIITNYHFLDDRHRKLAYSQLFSRNFIPGISHMTVKLSKKGGFFNV